MKLMRKVSVRWKNWSDFKALHSTQLRGDNWSKIQILSLNSQVRFRNYRIKLVALFQKIFRMLNQFAVEIHTFPVNQCLFHFVQYLKDCWDLRIASLQRRATKHLGHTWYIGKRFCKSRCVIFSTLSAGIESLEFQYRRAASLIHSGKEWETNTSSRSEMPLDRQPKVLSSTVEEILQRIMGQTSDCIFQIFISTNSLTPATFS